MVEVVQKMKEAIFDIVFPIECFQCGVYGSWWCQNCQDSLVLLQDRTCLGCGRNAVRGETCFTCLKSGYPLDGFLAASAYDEAAVKQAIGYLKYNGVRDLDVPLGTLIARTFLDSSIAEAWWHIMYVPLHVRRERMRGFNQSARLADVVSLQTGVEVLPLLNRIRATHPQRELSGKERRENMQKDTFRLTNPELVAGKNILLIDDVATTGSTLTACARVLKTAGVAKVVGLVVAQG